MALLKLPKVLELTALGRSSIYKMVAEGVFPAPIHLGARSVGWLDTEVQSWIDSRVAASRGTSAKEVR